MRTVRNPKNSIGNKLKYVEHIYLLFFYIIRGLSDDTKKFIWFIGYKATIEDS